MNEKENMPLSFLDLDASLTRLGNFARQYVKEATTLQDKRKRKREMIVLIEKTTNQIVIIENCPYGTSWDPITGTCK